MAASQTPYADYLGTMSAGAGAKLDHATTRERVPSWIEYLEELSD